MKFSPILFFVISALTLMSQTDTVILMAPTGPYSTGTTTYTWTDSTRYMDTASGPGIYRSLVVQIWYPANTESGLSRAPYAPFSADYNRVQAHSFQDPVFNKEIDQAPLIIIVPGRGTERFLYTTLSEELASAGFVVASVDLPEIGYVIYPDGRIIKPSAAFQPPPGMMAGPYEKVDAFFEKPTAIGNQDLHFVLDRIDALNSGIGKNQFAHKLDMTRIGVFSHSLGGRIAGKFVTENENILAYMSMEGIPPREVRYKGLITIPQVMLCSSGTLPYAIENYNSLINNRKEAVFMIELPDFGHNSVTDNPYIYPDQFSYAIDPETGLQITRKVTRAYFTAVLMENDLSIFTRTVQEMKGVKSTLHK